MTGLPKYLIKKYGVSKKAWQVFRGQKASSHRVKRVKYRTTSRGATMARRRHYRRSSGFGGGFSMKKVLVGAVVGYAASKFLGDNMLVKGGAGYLIMNGGIAGAAGAVIAPMLLNKLGSGTTSGAYFYG